LIDVRRLFGMQVYERAMEVYGSEDEMEQARLKKVERREKQQQKKFDKNVQGNGLQICYNMDGWLFMIIHMQMVYISIDVIIIITAFV